MKKKTIVVVICLLALILPGACTPVVKTVVVTQAVPQTEEVIRLVTQVVQVQITTTPVPATISSALSTLAFTPILPDSITETPPNTRITPTPGQQIADANTRPDVEQYVSSQYIKDYLSLSYGMTPLGGKAFCAYLPMGIGDDGHTIKLYLWTFCQEYFISNGDLMKGSASSTPVVLSVELRQNHYRIVDFKDAGLTYEDLETNFPPSIQKIITHEDAAQITRGAESFPLDVQKDAAAYYRQK